MVDFKKVDFGMPLDVKHKDPETYSVKEREEQEEVFRHLAPNYCICQHKKDKHKYGVGPCKHKGSRMFEGKIEEYECDCSYFESIENQAKTTPARNY